MPRRVVLSSHEKESLLALPERQDELIRYYTFNETDLALIRQRRSDANRLGFAVQLCLLRFPGCALTVEINVTDPVIYWAAGQIKADAVVWLKYAERDETRREHFVLWNTVYLKKAIEALKAEGQPVDDNLLQYLSPLGWEHINLTGDYVWQQNRKVGGWAISAITNR